MPVFPAPPAASCCDILPAILITASLPQGDIWLDPSLSGKVYIHTSTVSNTFDPAKTTLRANLDGGWLGGWVTRGICTACACVAPRGACCWFAQ